MDEEGLRAQLESPERLTDALITLLSHHAAGASVGSLLPVALRAALSPSAPVPARSLCQQLLRSCHLTPREWYIDISLLPPQHPSCPLNPNPTRRWAVAGLAGTLISGHTTHAVQAADTIDEASGHPLRRDLVTAAVIQDLAGSSSDRQFALTVLPDLPLQHALVQSLSYPSATLHCLPQPPHACSGFTCPRALPCSLSVADCAGRGRARDHGVCGIRNHRRQGGRRACRGSPAGSRRHHCAPGRHAGAGANGAAMGGARGGGVDGSAGVRGGRRVGRRRRRLPICGGTCV
jgi:hypothetical protein